tara:strand:- start:107 stop:808 length:702 start_codon:yes stop_codon:yes gene_type:complete
MSKVKEEILCLLKEYDDLFYSKNNKNLRDRYPRYVALYTPVLEKPDFAIVGTNPSWFIGKIPTDDKEKEKESFRTNSLKYVHDINSYTQYREPRYHKRIRSFFKVYVEKANTEYCPRRLDEFINKNVMGWNSQFIQTGSSGFTKLKNFCKKNDYFYELFLKANEIAERITELVKPKIIIHFGRASRDASGEYEGKKVKERKDGHRVFLHHPSQGYRNCEREKDIETLIELLHN